MGELVERKTLVKQAMKGILGIAGGIGMLILPFTGWLGWIIGGVLIALGVGASASKDDKFAGALLIGVGALGILSNLLFKGISRFLLIGGGIALILAGVFSLIKFFSNLKQRG